MAAFALSRVETHRNAASTAQPSDPPDEFITGHDIAYISVRMRMNLMPFVKMLSWLRTYETWGPPSGCFDRTDGLGDPRPHIKGRVSRLSERGQSSSQTMRSRSCGPSPIAAGQPPGVPAAKTPDHPAPAYPISTYTLQGIWRGAIRRIRAGWVFPMTQSAGSFGSRDAISLQTREFEDQGWTNTGILMRRFS